MASGGQIIRRMARRQMGLGEGEAGTAAFEYPLVRVWMVCVNECGWSEIGWNDCGLVE